jgi:hypothetical protein
MGHGGGAACGGSLRCRHAVARREIREGLFGQVRHSVTGQPRASLGFAWRLVT